ncbi:glucosaminidase domain-containing protein [Cytophagales bacterium LB-30]|uniref:Glucosaminidase domain-containing protein n=1 Tax=Shiella aurantiaca TaxID=3058365 RepID=A0ABT8F0W0_9BACT|nr:glucosaminidase domain-containing protein [Shiella aurantiaca]MDN4163984.1 glucosaminidase domain-containing protein [Shiella aurantiaca]
MRLSPQSVFAVFLLLLAMGACRTKNPTTFLAVEYRALASEKDIVTVMDTLVAPVIYQGTVSLKHLPVAEKKQKFVDLMLPAILVAKHHIDRDRAQILLIQDKILQQQTLSFSDSIQLNKFTQIYKTEDIDLLLRRMQTPPVSIVLAQAAVESGWGTSRFFTEANNVFGIWDYNGSHEASIKAKYARADKQVYLKKYDDLSASIYDYFQTLGRVKAYQEFRIANEQKQNPYQLVNHLNRYSEMGLEYVNKLKVVMKANDFTKYDQYGLHPGYFVRKTEGPGWFASM